MSRKRSLLRLDGQLDALVLFVYCKMLLSSDLFTFAFKYQPPPHPTNCHRAFFSCLLNVFRCELSALEVCTTLVGVRSVLLIFHRMFWGVNSVL